MSRSPAHKHYALADIEWMVMPPVAAGQYYVADATGSEPACLVRIHDAPLEE